jgi:hypothetical protein
MKYTFDEINDLVTDYEDTQGDYRALAEKAQAAWELKAFNRSWQDAINVDGQEQVTLPTPFNDVNLATRLLSSMPRIEVPASGETAEDEAVSERKERWLAAAYQRIYQQQRLNVVDLLKWQSFVRGKHAFSVNWVKDDYPKAMQDRVFPILLRPLDPLNVGICQNPLYTDYAYHKYTDSVRKIKARYPKLDWDSKDSKEEVEVVDFWYVNPKDGAIWNAVLVDDQYGKKPTKSDYKHIPIVVGYGDISNYLDSKWAALPLLYPIIDLWKYHCRLTSQMATGNLYYFWPHVAVMNENGSDAR